MNDFERAMAELDEIAALLQVATMMLKTSPAWLTAIVLDQDSRRVGAEELRESTVVWERTGG